MRNAVEVLNNLPPWAGSVPLWGLLAAVIVALIKVWPKLRELQIGERKSIADRYAARIAELAAEIKECRRLCDEQEESLRKDITMLQNRIMGMQKQHLQEQISLISVILRSVDSPALQQLLRTFESVQTALQQQGDEAAKS